jgi:mono/diheme cytochrome c family protein
MITVMFRPRHQLLAVLAACAALAGCGGGDDDGGGGEPAGGGGGGQTAATGEDIFKQRCASCHTLAAADANGSVGPNLDDLKPDRQRVLDAIANGPGVMPENVVVGAEAEAVADFVSRSAGG